MKPLLTPADAARILQVVPATVRAMALTGRLHPAAMTERGMRLFRREDVEALAQERRNHRATRSAEATHSHSVNTEEVSV